MLFVLACELLSKPIKVSPASYVTISGHQNILEVAISVNKNKDEVSHCSWHTSHRTCSTCSSNKLR